MASISAFFTTSGKLTSSVSKRDPERIDAILVAMRMLWVKYPDMRLGQMIEWLKPTEASTFYVEDDELLTRILRAIEEDDEPF